MATVDSLFQHIQRSVSPSRREELDSLRRKLDEARLTHQAKEQALQEKLDDTRQQARAWKERATAQERDIKTLSTQMAELREVAARRNHAVPSITTVHSSFRHRLSTLRARKSHVPPADREKHLMATAPGYTAALEAGPGLYDGQIRQVDLEGLTWRVPVRKSKTGSLMTRLKRQRLPLHGIMLTRELAIGGVMLDLGAHIGRMSIPRVVLGDAVAAYCAEPDPVSYACLVANVVDNDLRGMVLPDQTAIGATEGVVRFSRKGGPSAFRVLRDDEHDETAIEVPCTTLDAWVRKLAIDLEAVTFIKVDVEGFERALMRGATQTLACRHIAWQMEINPGALRNAGDTSAGLYEHLASAFTHFIDLNREVQGVRVRSAGELVSALAYIEPDGKTDILLFNA